jgi:esterase/lipase
VIKGLLIESGFPSVVRIISHLGIPAPGHDLKKIDRGCLEMISEISLPSLIIHGENDTLVPLENARELYDHLGTKEKELLVIHSASHNDVLIVGFKDYFKAIQRWTKKGETEPRSA